MDMDGGRQRMDDGWMDGRMDERTKDDGWTVGWMNGQKMMDGRSDG